MSQKIFFTAEAQRRRKLKFIQSVNSAPSRLCGYFQGF